MGAEWPDRQLGAIVRNFDARRVPLSSRERARRPGPYPYYGATGIMDYVDDFLFEGLHLLIAEDGSVETERGTPFLQLVDGRFWVNNHAHVLRGESDEDTRYLFYALSTMQIRPFMTGSVQAKLSQANLNRIRVPYPEPAARRAIAHVLGTLDDKIELNRRMNETLEAVARATFRSWFVDFDPVRAKAEGRDPPGMDAETAALFPDGFEDSPLGRLPKGWQTGAVADLAELSRDALNPTAFPTEMFAHFSIPAFDEGHVAKVETGDQIRSNKLIVPPDSVLLSKLNPRFPRVWLPVVDGSQRAICSTEFLVAVPRRPTTPSYLYALFSSGHFLDRFATLVTGTSGSHQRVKPSDLLSMSVVIPTAAVVERFTSIANPLYLRTQAALKESLALAALRDALLPKLISGQIRVKDAERFFAEVMP